MAPWCGPYRAQAPILDELAEAHKDTLKLCSVDIEQQPRLARNFGIAHLPTLMLFRGGLPEKTSVGIQNISQLENMLA